MNKNIIRTGTMLNSEDRESLKKNKGACVWFTGLSGSGKSTIANQLEAQLNRNGIHTYLLDGDNIRLGLNSDLHFSEQDRSENIRRAGEVAKLFVDAGIIVLTAFISPYAKDRNKVRQILPEGRFIEVFVDTDLSVCEMRDPKGLYRKARNNEIMDFTGISAPYELPVNPELHLINNKQSDLEDNIQQLIDTLRLKKLIQ